MNKVAIEVRALAKHFTLHNQGAARLRVLEGLSFEVHPGECVVLEGRSGSGKSTVLKCLYGTYRISGGSVRVLGCELAGASPRAVLALRRDGVGYIRQFLHVVPRVPALDVVAEELLEGGEGPEQVAAARRMAEALLLRLRIPMRLWSVPPATFSGGEQQRLNIARALVRRRPVLLADEPTASLDADNRATVVAMLEELRRSGTAIVGVFHDARVRDRLATRVVTLEPA